MSTQPETELPFPVAVLTAEASLEVTPAKVEDSSNSEDEDVSADG